MTRPLVRNLKTQNSVTESVTDSAFRSRAFVTLALSTIHGPGGHDFEIAGKHITFVCHHSTDRNLIDKAFSPDNQIPALTQEVKCLGGVIVCNEASCSLFPVDGEDLQIGKKYYHFLIKRHKHPLLVSISLEIRGVTRPSAATFTRDVRVRAAMSVFKSKMEAAHLELEKELRHIVDTEIDNALSRQAS